MRIHLIDIPEIIMVVEELTELDDDVDENHEKRRSRKERRTGSDKARSHRQLLKDKNARKYETGFGGNA